MLVSPLSDSLALARFMSDCCDPTSYNRLFNDREAKRRLKNYRKRGLDPMATQLVEYMEQRGVEGRSVLEIGGGVGDLQVELLKVGASHSVNVELSTEYENAATTLMESEDLVGRMDRRLGDFVEQGDSVATADIVVLNRVICCYPWMSRLMVVPRDRIASRAFVAIGNVINRLIGNGFRAYVHSVSDIEQLAADAGLHQVFSSKAFVWKGMVFERS
jgi:predicted RNA methylase